MPLRVVHGQSVLQLPYLPTMCMGNYLRYIIAPSFELKCSDAGDTVLAKVHTPDLRVVFNNECKGRLLKEFLIDESHLIISPWNENDKSTCKSLVGNIDVISVTLRSTLPGF